MKYFIFILWFSALFIGCTPIQIVTDGGLESDMSSFSTYNFYDFSFERYDSLPYDENKLALIKKIIDENMILKGFTVSDNPDLLINIGVVIKQQTQTRETDPALDMNYIGQRNYHWEREDKIVGLYEEGAISLDFVEPKTNRLVWQGTAIGIITSNQKAMKKRMEYAINGIFEKMKR